MAPHKYILSEIILFLPSPVSVAADDPIEAKGS